MVTVPRYLITTALMGLGIGVIFGLALLITDAIGLRSLVLASGISSTIAIFLMGCAMTFAPPVIATAIGLLGVDL